MEPLEAKSYLAPYDPAARPVVWFNDDFPPDTWSKPHVHPWGELAYTGHGCMVMCTEQGNWLAPPQPGRLGARRLPVMNGMCLAKPGIAASGSTSAFCWGWSVSPAAT